MTSYDARPVPEVLAEAGAQPHAPIRLGERATLLQFSSAFCAPCRATRQVLSGVAGLVPGVAHVEVDADTHLAATRALGITGTPTTLVLDAEGHEVTRAEGVPSRRDVLGVLGGTLPAG